jgi:hypothetical protein
MRADRGRAVTAQALEPSQVSPGERGPGKRRGGTEVLRRFVPPLVERAPVGDGAPVAEAREVERPDVHHRLEPVEFVGGELDVPAIRVRGGGDPVPVVCQVPQIR